MTLTRSAPIPALPKSCSTAQSVSPVASTSSTTTTDAPLGTTSSSISIRLSFEPLDAEDEIWDTGLTTETVAGGSLPESRISARGTLTRAANADADAVGTDPLALCPHRDLAQGVQPQGMSFGDGAHRCPGAFVAIQESDVFLQRLLKLPLRVERPPRLDWNARLESYEVRDFKLEVERADDAGTTERGDGRSVEGGNATA